eukprot:497441-Amorphochlora_amoeboformis.AAC.1
MGPIDNADYKKTGLRLMWSCIILKKDDATILSGQLNLCKRSPVEELEVVPSGTDSDDKSTRCA